MFGQITDNKLNSSSVSKKENSEPAHCFRGLEYSMRSHDMLTYWGKKSDLLSVAFIHEYTPHGWRERLGKRPNAERAVLVRQSVLLDVFMPIPSRHTDLAIVDHCKGWTHDLAAVPGSSDEVLDGLLLLWGPGW